MMTSKIVTTWLRGDDAADDPTQRPAHHFPESAQQAAARGDTVDRQLMDGQFAVAVLALIVGSALFVAMVMTGANEVTRPFDYHAPTSPSAAGAPRAIAPPVEQETPSVRPKHPETATWDSWMLDGAIDRGETSELEAIQAARNARIAPKPTSRCPDLCIVNVGER